MLLIAQGKQPIFKDGEKEEMVDKHDEMRVG
jgi:hypothetical protein